MNHERKRNRLAGYDYSTPGAYFVTICVKNVFRNQNIFGEIIDNKMQLNKTGEIAYQTWQEIPEHYDNIKLDEFIIMPDHIHGIITVVGAEQCSALTPIGTVRTEQCSVLTVPTEYGKLSKIIKSFKNAVTNRLKLQYNEPPFVWQRSFYDHIVRDDEELNRIREYIINNPLKNTVWAEHCSAPTNISTRTISENAENAEDGE